jgi:ribosomal protein L37AE/L43A
MSKIRPSMIATAMMNAYITKRLAWDKAVVNSDHTCPNCGETAQVQIKDTMDEGGPLWKCRMCRHKFHTVPPSNAERP